MVTEGHRYSISRKGRLIDSDPLRRGELPLVWDPDHRKWIDLELTFGEHMDTVPITDEDAEHFLKTGERSGRTLGSRVEMSEDFSEG